MNQKGAIAPLLIGIPLGLLLGVGVYTLGYAKGFAYLTDDPAACTNCHVMRQQYEGWLKSSHKNVAVCNDCHTPPGLAGKYTIKALNGFNHSMAFTTGNFPDNIHITGRNQRVAKESCMKCHEELTSEMNSARRHGDDADCVSCHRNVGHAH